MRSLGRILWCAVFGLVLAALTASCHGTSPVSRPGPARKLVVVAAENFWGSIARQEGGGWASVSSIIVNPNADPHAYEPSASDARLIAGANLFIYDGLGYDPWAPKLVAANPVTGRKVLEAAAWVKPVAGNPHIWYNPTFVERIAAAITRAYIGLDPEHSAYFQRRHAHFVSVALGPYHHAIRFIASHFRGTPVGATESIFEYLAPALGLRLVTPPGFMKAISEGAEPTATDKNAFDQQIAEGRIWILVFNRQNATPDVNALIDEARGRHIPIASITETLDPASASFEAWQTRQLNALASALNQARRTKR